MNENYIPEHEGNLATVNFAFMGLRGPDQEKVLCARHMKLMDLSPESAAPEGAACQYSELHESGPWR